MRMELVPLYNNILIQLYVLCIIFTKVYSHSGTSGLLHRHDEINCIRTVCKSLLSNLFLVTYIFTCVHGFCRVWKAGKAIIIPAHHRSSDRSNDTKWWHDDTKRWDRTLVSWHHAIAAWFPVFASNPVTRLLHIHRGKRQDCHCSVQIYRIIAWHFCPIASSHREDTTSLRGFKVHIHLQKVFQRTE